MLDGKQNSESDVTDPEQLAQLLEIELMQKRAGWRQAQARSRTIRGVSFLFLFVIIAGGLAAFFVFMPSAAVHEGGSRPGDSIQATHSPSPAGR